MTGGFSQNQRNTGGHRTCEQFDESNNLSNVCCAMCDVVVKAPNDLTDQTNQSSVGERLRHMSLGQWVLGQSSLDIAQQTFDI